MKCWCRCDHCGHQSALSGNNFSVEKCPRCNKKGHEVHIGNSPPDWWTAEGKGIVSRILSALASKP